jgi:hypothetical protein
VRWVGTGCCHIIWNDVARQERQVRVHAEFQEVVPYEGVCANAQGFDVLADSVALVSHVLADVIGCARG